MANVYDVANFFVEMTNATEDDTITNLKLNKLMYFAQGCFLARTGKRLFPEDIEAWTYGPVVPEVYHKYKVCGRNAIESVDDDFTVDSFTEEELETLIDVMREMAKYTSSTLVSITHREDSPWSHTNESNVISDSLLVEYFRDPKNEIRKFSLGSAETVETLPASWYDPEEDDIWGDLS